MNRGIGQLDIITGPFSYLENPEFKTPSKQPKGAWGPRGKLVPQPSTDQQPTATVPQQHAFCFQQEAIGIDSELEFKIAVLSTTSIYNSTA